MKHPALLALVIDRFNTLYVRMRREWIEQRPTGQYTHRRIQKTGDRTTGWLTDREIRQHLLGRRTIGIFHPNPTVVLAFDLDFHTPDITIREGLTRAFVRDVERQLGPGSCHVWDTTGKGYRVEVFFCKPIPWSTVQGLAALILDRPWYDDTPADLAYSWRHNPYVTVELRPERPNGGRGVKLPLGIDQRNGKFCAFLDPHTLQPVPDQYDYFLSIQPIDPARIPAAASTWQPAASTARNDESGSTRDVIAHLLHNASAQDILERCQRLWEHGLEHRGTRHTSLLLLAMWRLWLAPDTTEAELTALLTGWTERELRERPHLIDHDRDHCLRDARQVAADVYRGGYSLAALLRREPLLTASALAALRSIRHADQRMVFLALLLHRYLYTGPDGTFHMAYAQIATLLGWQTNHKGVLRPDNGRVGVAVRALLKHRPDLLTKVAEPDLIPTPGRTFRRSTRYRIHLPSQEAHQIPWPAPLEPGSLTPEVLNSAIALLEAAAPAFQRPSAHLEANFSPRPALGRQSVQEQLSASRVEAEGVREEPPASVLVSACSPLRAAAAGQARAAVQEGEVGVPALPPAPSLKRDCFHVRVYAGGCLCCWEARGGAFSAQAVEQGHAWSGLHAPSGGHFPPLVERLSSLPRVAASAALMLPAAKFCILFFAAARCFSFAPSHFLQWLAMIGAEGGPPRNL